MDAIYNNPFVQKISTFFCYLIYDIADKRTINWPLMEDPVWICFILWLYVSFVTSWGPKFMKNREPFKMKKLLIFYNFSHVIFSGWLSYHALFRAYLSGAYSLKCEPVNWARNIDGMIPARGCYWYFLAKISELLDTVFIILRKKDKQVTFLHIFHHSGMVIMSYGVTKYYPGGNVIFYGMVNSMVHTVMYLYYMIAAMGPEFQKYLWWKKYITKIQMLQFFLGVLHASQLLYTDCGFPRWSIFVLLPNLAAFYFLFYDFYKQSYLKAEADKKLRDMKKDKEVSNTNSDSLNVTEQKSSSIKSTTLLKHLLLSYVVGVGIFITGFHRMQIRNMELIDFDIYK